MNRRDVHKQMLSIHSSRLDEVLIDDTKGFEGEVVRSDAIQDGLFWLARVPDMPLNSREVVRSKWYQCRQLPGTLFGIRRPVSTGDRDDHGL